MSAQKYSWKTLPNEDVLNEQRRDDGNQYLKCSHS